MFAQDIIIYNEESDRHVKITWNQALKATLAEAVLAVDDDWFVAATAWNEMNMNGYNKSAAVVRAAKPYIVVARPFIEHLMHSAVVTVAGRDTGATLFGPAGVLLPPSPTPRRSHTEQDRATPRPTRLRPWAAQICRFRPTLKSRRLRGE